MWLSLKRHTFEKEIRQMKKTLALLLVLIMAFSLTATTAFADDPITLDVIICQYGPNTNDWFLGKGMNGSNFVEV